jgi:hypothetical protein
MSDKEKPKLSFSWAQRWSAGLNLLIAVAAVLAPSRCSTISPSAITRAST